LDLIPGLGYVKGIVHFACGDYEKGCKGLTLATRTIAVLLAGEAARKVGQTGGVVAAVGTGACCDLVTAALSNGRHVHGFARVRGSQQNSWGRGGIEILGDVICGMSTLVDANKEPWKIVMKQGEENIYKNYVFLFGLAIRSAGSVTDQRPSPVLRKNPQLLDDR
jgi:hypothetical protein